MEKCSYPDSYGLFKPLKNKIGKYDPIKLAILIAKKINEVENLPYSKWQGWNPRYLITLLKWGFEYGGKKHPPSNLNLGSLADIVNKIRNFESECGSPFLPGNDLASINKYFRTIANQQFWFQRTFDNWSISRQYVLFCDTPKKRIVSSNFLNEFQLSIESFLDLSFVIWAWLAKANNPCKFKPGELFQNIKIQQETINKYIEMLSLNRDNAKTYLESQPNRIENPLFQLNEPSPFINKPFLLINDEVLVYSKKIFENTINDFVFDQIKKTLQGNAVDQFGYDMETYVENAL